MEADGLLGDAHDAAHVLVLHAHFIKDEEEDISQLSTFVWELFVPLHRKKRLTDDGTEIRSSESRVKLITE